MARTKRTAGRARTKTTVAVKQPRRERAPRTEVEIVEEDSGPGWETGVAILTALLILAAILITDYGLGFSGEGIFFG